MATSTFYAQINFCAKATVDTVLTGQVGLCAKSDGLYAKLPGATENLLLVVKGTPQNGLIAFFDDTKAIITSTSFSYDPVNYVMTVGAFNNNKDTVLLLHCNSTHLEQANIIDCYRSDDLGAIDSGCNLLAIKVNGNVSGSAATEVGEIKFTAIQDFSDTRKGTQYALKTHTADDLGSYAVRHLVSGTGLTRIEGGLIAGSVSTDPLSMLQSAGSIGAAMTLTSGDLTLTAAHFAVVVKGAHTITLPSASAVTGRIYVIANKQSAAITISAYYDLSDSSTTSVPLRSSIIIQSNGTYWHQIN
jgi:hypothetical protein